MGRVFGGGTSINGMVWARGHKNDFDDWAKRAGDEAWGYRCVLDIYKRIEHLQCVPEPQRRGRSAKDFMQTGADSHPIAFAIITAAVGCVIQALGAHNGVRLVVTCMATAVH